MADKLTIRTADGRIITANEMGIKALRRIYKCEPETLKDAEIEDVVVGKGAAAFMIMGGVKRVRAGVMSSGAKEMMENANTKYSFENLVDAIVNKQRNAQCGIEALLTDTVSPDECVRRISKHFNDQWSV